MAGSSNSQFAQPDLRLLTREEVRGIDAACIEEYGLPGIALMENAGRGAAEVLLELGVAGNVLIVAGKGNNGGDGFVLARHLQLHGIDATIVLTCDPAEVSGDARTNLNVAIAAGIRVQPYDRTAFAKQMTDADWVIDALLGTGATGAPRPPADAVITAVNAASCRVVAIDIPSGLDCDTGETPGECVEADHTITFVSLKVGMIAPRASAFVGQAHVVGIGAPLVVLEPYLASSL